MAVIIIIFCFQRQEIIITYSYITEHINFSKPQNSFPWSNPQIYC